MQPNPYYPYRSLKPIRGGMNGPGYFSPAIPPRNQPGVQLPADVIPPGTIPTGTDVVPSGPGTVSGPPAAGEVGYIQEYLARNIGRYVKIEFLIGTNMLVDREGVIREVGTNYVVIQEPETDDLLMADLYAVKFVRTYY